VKPAGSLNLCKRWYQCASRPFRTAPLANAFAGLKQLDERVGGGAAQRQDATNIGRLRCAVNCHRRRPPVLGGGPMPVAWQACRGGTHPLGPQGGGLFKHRPLPSAGHLLASPCSVTSKYRIALRVGTPQA
jgi:hypothetical protein